MWPLRPITARAAQRNAMWDTERAIKTNVTLAFASTFVDGTSERMVEIASHQLFGLSMD